VRRAVFWDITTSVTSVVLSVIALALHLDVATLLLCAAANYGMFAAFTWPTIRSVPVIRSTAVEVDKFTLYAVIGTAANTGLLQLCVLVSGAVGGATGAGQFSAAFVLATPMTLFSTGIRMVLFPRLAHAVGREDVKGLRAIADRATRIFTVIMVPAFGAVIILRFVIVDTVWGPSFSETAQILPIMLFALLATCLAIPSVNVITSESSGGAGLSAIFTGIGAIACCLSWILFIPLWKLQGVAAGYLVGTVISSVIPYVVTWRRTHQTWLANSVRIGAGVLLITLIMVIQQRRHTSPWMDVGFAIVFLIIWAAVCFRDARRLLFPSRA
jgi:putative peptidoglycan lipid II flippase